MTIPESLRAYASIPDTMIHLHGHPYPLNVLMLKAADLIEENEQFMREASDDLKEIREMIRRDTEVLCGKIDTGGAPPT